MGERKRGFLDFSMSPHFPVLSTSVASGPSFCTVLRMFSPWTSQLHEASMMQFQLLHICPRYSEIRFARDTVDIYVVLPPPPPPV